MRPGRTRPRTREFPLNRHSDRNQGVNICQHRGGLARTRKRLADGQLTIGFTGGSVTDPRLGNTWPEPVIGWFAEKFPRARLVVENAAVGATSSDLAVFRAQCYLIDRQCDLVFVEFAANDSVLPTAQRTRTREELLRKLLAGTGRDVVLTYIFFQEMYAEMIANKVPASIAEFEELGAHYGLGSVWMGLHALREVQRGQMRWEEWLPDGMHPQHRGSLSYAQSVISFLERELITAPSVGSIPTGDRRPTPLNPRHWEAGTCLPFDAVKLDGPWTVRRWWQCVGIEQVLDTAAVGAKLAFEFEGRALSLAFDFGKASADFRYRLDEREWVTHSFDRPAWCGPPGWYRIVNVADDLAGGSHHFELEVIHGNRPDCAGTNLRLALIGVVK